MTSIIDKIRKLQALADNAGTEHEAALAAQRIADLCREHNLDVGVTTLEQEEKTASESVHETVGLWNPHYSTLANACVEVFHVGHYKARVGVVKKNNAGMVISSKTGNALHFYGLKANVQAALETYEYLLASVESLLESHLRTGGQLKGRADYRAFRFGCATRIREAAKAIKQASHNLLEGSADCQALVRLENQLIKRHAEGLRLRAGKRMTGVSFGDAYSAGYAAGGRVNFHGARSSRMIGGGN